MTVANASVYEETVHLALGAFTGGVCVWEFSSTEGLTSCFSDADAHTGTVRAAKFTSTGQLMTAGDDGIIQVINARKKSRVALLEAHEDQVNALSLVEEKSGFIHVLSAANDASIGVWGRLAGRWECKRRMRRHRGPVLALAAHPSGRLALSLGADGTLRTWNLLRGRQAFVVKLKCRPERAVDVLWSPDGSRYVIQFPHRFDCYSVEAAQTPSCSVSVPEGVTVIAFLSSSILVFAAGLRLSFRNIMQNGAEISSLSLSCDDGDRSSSKVRSLVWDQHQRLLFVLTRHSQGGALAVYRLPPQLTSEGPSQSEEANALMLCRTEIPFRVTSFDACRFAIRRASSAAGAKEGDEDISKKKKVASEKKKNEVASEKIEGGSKESKVANTPKKKKSAVLNKTTDTRKQKKRKLKEDISQKAKKKRWN